MIFKSLLEKSMKKINTTFLLLFLTAVSFAQQLVWTGNANDNDFFNEQNWNNQNTTQPPIAGSINSGIAINMDLLVENVSSIINANGLISLGSGSLTLNHVQINSNAVSGGEIIINENGYLHLAVTTPLQGEVQIKLNSGLGWVRTENLRGNSVQANHLNQISVNNQPAVYETNLRLDNYYFKGTVIRSNASTTPIRLYENTNLQGDFADLSVNLVHSAGNIPNGMNNNAASFILKKGFMATLSANADGTGKSKNYIASEQDLVINALPEYLINQVSFVRVMPWNWVSKKGRTGSDTELNNTWQYQWNNTGNSSVLLEYAPMAWGAGGADSDADVELYKSKYKSQHVMGFNESDNCNDQSGQFNNLCDTDVAVNLYRTLMKTGLRMVSPSCRENAPFDWLKEFTAKANALDIRMDVIAVHWYDWGSNPQNSPNASAQQVFNRFKTYLTNVHNLHGLPIWITEFNANPNRTTAVNLAFMQLALPYLETLDYVERYVWYQPNSGVADYYNNAGTALTNMGTFYQNQVSTKSIPEATWQANSTLDSYYNIVGNNPNNLLDNADFELGNLTAWFGENIDILTNANVYQGTTSGRILANPGYIYHLVPVEPSQDYDLSFFCRWFVAPTETMAVQILNASNDAVIATQMMNMNTTWNEVNFSFSIPANVQAIKIYIEKGQQPGWFIDNVVLQKNDTLNIESNDLISSDIYPNPSSDDFHLKSNQWNNNYENYRMQGQLILKKSDLNAQETQIDLSGQPKGIYILKMQSANKMETVNKLILR